MTQPTSDNFATHFETLNLDEATLEIDHGETIVPPNVAELFAEPVKHLDTLPRLSVEGTPGTIPDLRLIGTLGEGGMGLVRLATQIALAREVAVKTLRDGTGDNAAKLLQEAYVTGKLEHPNIVPIYTLGVDDDDRPLIVMKRIEGVSWLDVLADPSVAPNDHEPDLLWHLDVLRQVCNALRYAHSHDVIHRDIKPENVMIGPFGEVYLLDWGIAVSIAEDEEDAGPMPHRNTVDGMCGTPAYMAPELTNDDAAAHDVRTDVYLLGANLHQVVTGEPRHTGKNLFEVMKSSFESEPYEYPDDVPAELAGIANRAMAKEPDDRFQSVDDFKQAIVDYVDHRASHELAEEAAQLLEQIEDVLAASLADTAERDVRLHDLFVECRFACQQALKAWPENEAARQTYVDFLVQAVRQSLDRGDLHGADALVAELESAGGERPDLRADLEALAAERESERAEVEGLREFASELDLRRGRVSRSLAVLGMGVLWCVTTLWTFYRTWTGDITDFMEHHIDAAWRAVGIGVLALVIFRKQLFSTSGNRRFAYVVILALIGVAVFRVIGATHTDVSIGVARSFENGLYGAAASAAGLVADDLRICILGLGYFAIALLDPWVGVWQLFAVSIYHFVFLAGVAYLWTPGQLERRWSI